jgi:hypothetical protein
MSGPGHARGAAPALPGPRGPGRDERAGSSPTTSRRPKREEEGPPVGLGSPGARSSSGDLHCLRSGAARDTTGLPGARWFRSSSTAAFAASRLP